jgi:hypothetical protein
VLPFIGRWKKVARAAGEVAAAATLSAWQNGGGRGLNAVGMSGTVVQTRRLTGGPQRFQIFSNLSKNG